MTEPSSTNLTPPPQEAPAEGVAPDRHLAFGWVCLCLFVVLGVVLETLHGFKSPLYLDVSNGTRRLMWRLAHAHGTLLGLVHILFALCLPSLPGLAGGRRLLASRCLYAGSVLLPLGFLLGGVFVYAGDPGLPIVLAPIGGVLLVVAIVLIAHASLRRG